MRIWIAVIVFMGLVAGRSDGDAMFSTVAQMVEYDRQCDASGTRPLPARKKGQPVKTAEPKPVVVETIRLPVPPPPDAIMRLDRFQKRNSPGGLRELGERFFSQMSLEGPGLERVSQLVRTADYAGALEAYKAYFFAKLVDRDEGDVNPEGDGDDEKLDGEARNSSKAAKAPSDKEIQDALAGLAVEQFSIKGKSVRVEANLGLPGAMNWVFVDQSAIDNDKSGVVLAFCRRQNVPGGNSMGKLLDSYATGGPTQHLARWSELVDDWTMNWPADVERSPLQLRDYNLLIVCRIQAMRGRFASIARMRPSFVKDLPAPTLARMLMVMNEEYVSSAIRLGRSGLYNFRIMALNSMIPTSLKMQEFHVHQWAVREGWRQVDDNFIYKIRQDGANFEFANDGHENTDQSMTMPFRQLKAWNAQPPWTEPFWADESMDNFLSNTRYWVHNLKQDGCSYRLNYRSQKGRYMGDNPLYKVNLLTNEAEVASRLWKVFRIGKPVPSPKVLSESLAFQGYYYLRSGWEPTDYFLYFQSIGQPILSGREDNTGFSLYGHGTIHMLCPAPAVDGKTQNIHYGLVLEPGGKANFCTYGKPNVVKEGRFLADGAFDLVEGTFKGVYQYHRPSDFFDSFGSYGYEATLARVKEKAAHEHKPFVDEPIRDVTQSRQVLSIRGRETYIVTDYYESGSRHAFTQNYTLYTPVNQDHLEQRLKLLHGEKAVSFVADHEAKTLTTCNVGLPNTQIRQFSAWPIRYEVSEDQVQAANGDAEAAIRKFNKRDRQHSGPVSGVQFSRKVAANWEGTGSQVLVSVVTPRGKEYLPKPGITLHDVKACATRPDRSGFTAKYSDGVEIGYMASSVPSELTLGVLKANASAILLVGDSGIALDCSALAVNGQAIVPSCADFEFRLIAGRAVEGNPIYRPIKPVIIEPAVNVFTESQTVSLSDATQDVETRYTLDGKRPTPDSPLYAGPFSIDKTCRVKARAFRKGVREDVWQEDGTYATAVFSAVFRKENPLPGVEVGRTVPGLKYDYFEGNWTELMARSLTIPAMSSGVCRLLEVGMRKTNGAFGVRYEGYLDIPKRGVYTFHAPNEFIYPDVESGYDLRVFVDGKEWYPAVRWHGHGDWSVALDKGKHAFKVVFVDMRKKPHKIELMWGFPHPDFTWKGVAPELLVSGPDLVKQALPEAMLCHGP